MRTETIKIVNLTEEELKNLIVEAIQSELEALKQEPPPKVRYLTRKEVAHLLKVSLVTVHEWSKEGILPSYRIGNRVLYKESDIDASLTSRFLYKRQR